MKAFTEFKVIYIIKLKIQQFLSIKIKKNTFVVKTIFHNWFMNYNGEGVLVFYGSNETTILFMVISYYN